MPVLTLTICARTRSGVWHEILGNVPIAEHPDNKIALLWAMR